MKEGPQKLKRAPGVIENLVLGSQTSASLFALGGREEDEGRQSCIYLIRLSTPKITIAIECPRRQLSTDCPGIKAFGYVIVFLVGCSSLCPYFYNFTFALYPCRHARLQDTSMCWVFADKVYLIIWAQSCFFSMAFFSIETIIPYQHSKHQFVSGWYLLRLVSSLFLVYIIPGYLLYILKFFLFYINEIMTFA